MGSMAALNLAQRLFIDDDGTLCQITNMFDADGEDTDEPDMCATFVAKRSEGEWIADDARNYDAVMRA